MRALHTLLIALLVSTAAAGQADTILSTKQFATRLLPAIRAGFTDSLRSHDSTTMAKAMDSMNKATTTVLTGSYNATTRMLSVTPARGSGAAISLPAEAPTADSVIRALNTAFQVSASRAARVTYSVKISCTLTVSGLQAGQVYLETSADGTTWRGGMPVGNEYSGTLVAGVNLTHAPTYSLTRLVPAGYWVRLRTSGTATITYVKGQETLL